MQTLEIKFIIAMVTVRIAVYQCNEVRQIGQVTETKNTTTTTEKKRGTRTTNTLSELTTARQKTER